MADPKSPTSPAVHWSDDSDSADLLSNNPFSSPRLLNMPRHSTRRSSCSCDYMRRSSAVSSVASSVDSIAEELATPSRSSAGKASLLHQVGKAVAAGNTVVKQMKAVTKNSVKMEFGKVQMTRSMERR